MAKVDVSWLEVENGHCVIFICYSSSIAVSFVVDHCEMLEVAVGIFLSDAIIYNNLFAFDPLCFLYVSGDTIAPVLTTLLIFFLCPLTFSYLLLSVLFRCF